jgi:ketosteroid isomerase-like protein
MPARKTMSTTQRISTVKKIIVALAVSLFLGACTSVSPASHKDLEEQVKATERAFAKTMADRDFAAFTHFLSSEAIFFSSGEATRGSAKIAAGWAPFFKNKAAPFSWSPEHVEVLDSGTLALSTGPVLDAHGKLIANYNSIWRREPNGEWKIIFDKGSDVCQVCAAAQ